MLIVKIDFVHSNDIQTTVILIIECRINEAQTIEETL